MALWATVDLVALDANVGYSQMLLTNRIAYLGASFVPSTFLCFILALIGRPSHILGCLALGLSCVMSFLSFTPLLVADIQIRPFRELPGPLYPVFLGFLGGCLSYGIWLLWKTSLKAASSYFRNQVRYVLFATIAGLTAVIIFALVTYRWSVPPVHFVIEVGVASIFAFAIVRHRLMDVTVAVTRTTIFALVYIVVLGLPLLAALLYQPILESVFGVRWWVWLWVVCSAFATAAHYVNAHLQGRADARLLGEQRRYQATLRQASQGMTQVRDLDKLLRLIVHVVTKSVQLTHGSVFLKTWKDESYEVKVSRDKERMPLGAMVSAAHPLVRLLQESEGPLVTEELELMLSQEGREASGDLSASLDFLHKYSIALVVPSFVESQLLGFLALGPKRSGKPFAQEDIGVFSTLANQAALAVENALFFEELKTTQAQLFHSEKLATMGQLASSMAHEIHNPLAVISGEAQLLLVGGQVYDAQTVEFLNDIVKQCKRAEEITDRLLNFSRAPKDAKPVPLDVNEIVTDSLKLVEHQVKMESVELVRRLADGLPVVLGNRTQIQEIFLNLSLNACQAMKEQEGARLEVASSRNGKFVEVIFRDNGPGISREHIRRIFDPFFTTKSTGTGLGLFICDRIIREHQGKIVVESEMGKGTTFTVRLPIADKQAGESG